MRRVNFLLIVQGIYWLLTGLWGLLDINSFMKVTGPKTDIWLVKTVSVLIIAVGITLLTAVKTVGNKTPSIALAILGCAALAAIDIYYSLQGIISKIYLLDAAAEILLLLAWIIVLAAKRKEIKR